MLKSGQRSLCALAFLAALPLAASAQSQGAPLCDEPTSLSCTISKETTGSWTATVETTPLGSGTLVRLATRSINDIPAIFGGDTKATLQITCAANSTRFALSFGDNFMSDLGSYGDVVYRVDDGQVQVASFTTSSDNQMLMAPAGIASIGFIRELFMHDMLNVSVRTFTDSRISAAFEITDLEQAIAPVREACNW